MKKQTKDSLGALKKLVKQATDNIYERIRHADLVLQDLGWIEEYHDGSDIQAQDAIQSEFFPDLNGYITIGKLRAMYHCVPTDEWEELRYDIAAVEAVYDSQAIKDPPNRNRKSWKAEAEHAIEESDRLKRANEQLNDLNKRQEDELRSLRQQVAELTAQNERLRGRLEELEKFAKVAA